MADITMCTGRGCERKDYCYRHTAPINEYRQAYFMNPPITREGCEYFWRNEHEKVLDNYQNP